MSKILAIDLGGTSAKCGFVLNDKIVHSFNVKTNINKVLENIYEYCKLESEKVNFSLSDLDAIGFASPGLVDTKNGVVVYASNLNWTNFNLKEELKKIFICKNIFVINDGKAATYGCWKTDFDKRIKSMMLVTLGTGIGGGVIINNSLIVGDNTGLPSEPGHGGGFQEIRSCVCGLVGCVEPVASGSGMEYLLHENAKVTTGLLHELQNANPQFKLVDIKPLFEKNDVDVVSSLTQSLDVLAKMLSIMIHTFDMQTIVIAGGPTNLGEGLIAILKQEIKKYILPVFYNKLNIVFASNKGNAGLIGIKEFVLDQLNHDNS